RPRDRWEHARRDIADQIIDVVLRMLVPQIGMEHLVHAVVGVPEVAEVAGERRVIAPVDPVVRELPADGREVEARPDLRLVTLSIDLLDVDAMLAERDRVASPALEVSATRLAVRRIERDGPDVL